MSIAAPASAEPGCGPSGRTPEGWAALIVAAIVVAYANSLHGPFVLDDPGSITDNASIRQLWPLGPVLSPPAHAGVGGRPVANLSFALNYAVGGLNPFGYHVVNLALHVAAALLLFGLVRRTLSLPRPRETLPVLAAAANAVAASAALLWALHPLQTETVTYVSQRTEGLMALFYLATVYGFVRAVSSPRRGWYVFAVLACALGMATKEVMVTAPALIFLYDRTFVAGSFRAAWQARARQHLGLAATWLLLCLLLHDVGQRGVGHASVTWWEYGLTSSRSILHYLRLAFWPSPLVFDYGAEVVRHGRDVWPQLVSLAGLLGAMMVALRRTPAIGFALAWFLLLLAPASSVVPVAGQTMAEHRLYLPLAAVAVSVAVAAQRWLGPRAWLLLAPAAALLGGTTWARNRDYRDAVTLWSDTVAKRPTNARAHASLGAAYLAQNQLAPAVAALERALALDPFRPEAHNNLAMALVELSHPARAVAHFEAALKLRPGTASTHYNYGNALLLLGRTTDAISQQEQALRLRNDFPEASCALGQALASAGRIKDALPHFETALRLQADLTAAHFGLANALVQAGQFAEAITHYEHTLRAAPTSVEARYNFATALAQAGRIAEAIAQFEQVLRLQPGLEAAERNLAALRRALQP